MSIWNTIIEWLFPPPPPRYNYAAAPEAAKPMEAPQLQQCIEPAPVKPMETVQHVVKQSPYKDGDIKKIHVMRSSGSGTQRVERSFKWFQELEVWRPLVDNGEVNERGRVIHDMNNEHQITKALLNDFVAIKEIDVEWEEVAPPEIPNDFLPPNIQCEVNIWRQQKSAYEYGGHSKMLKRHQREASASAARSRGSLNTAMAWSVIS